MLKQTKFEDNIVKSTQLLLVLFGRHDFHIFPDCKVHECHMELGSNCVWSRSFSSESAVKYVGALRRGENRSKQHFAIGLVNSVLNLPEVKFFGKFKLQKNCNQCCL